MTSICVVDIVVLIIISAFLFEYFSMISQNTNLKLIAKWLNDFLFI